MSLQLFGVLSPGEEEEDTQLMIVEVEPCGGCNLFYFNFSFSPAFFLYLHATLSQLINNTDKNEYYKRSRLQQKSLQRLSRRLAATSDILEACHVAAEEVRNVTNLDRVMVYHFDKDWHGDILIELTGEGMQVVLCRDGRLGAWCAWERCGVRVCFMMYLCLIRHSSKLLGSAVSC